MVGAYNYYKRPQDHFIRDLNMPVKNLDQQRHMMMELHILQYLDQLPISILWETKQSSRLKMKAWNIMTNITFVPRVIISIPPLSPVHPFVRQDPTLTHATVIIRIIELVHQSQMSHSVKHSDTYSSQDLSVMSWEYLVLEKYH